MSKEADVFRRPSVLIETPGNGWKDNYQTC